MQETNPGLPTFFENVEHAMGLKLPDPAKHQDDNPELQAWRLEDCRISLVVPVLLKTSLP